MATSYAQLKNRVSGTTGSIGSVSKGGKISSYSQLKKSIPAESLAQVRERLAERDKEKQKVDNFNRAQAEAERYAREAEKAQKRLSFWETIASIPKEIVKGAIVRPAISLAEIPLNVATGGRKTFGEINVPGLGPVESYQNEAGRISGEIVEGQKPLRSILKPIGESVLDVASLGITGGVVKQGAKAGIGAGIRRGVAEGAAYGAGYGMTQALGEGQGLRDSVRTAGIGAALGAGLGGGLGVAGGIASKAIEKSALRNTVKNIENKIGRLDINEISIVEEGLKGGYDEEAILKGIRKAKEAEVKPKETTKTEDVTQELSKKTVIYKEESKTYDAESLSKGIDDSILNAPSKADKKPNRLTGEKVSIKEAQTGLAENGQYLKDRIVVGKDDAGKVIMKDGTHLLEAYRREGIEIPADKVKFEDGVTLSELQKKINVNTDATEKLAKTAEASAIKSDVEKATSAFAKRLNEQLPENLKIDEEYDVAKLKGEADKAADLIAKDKQKAIRIASGIEKTDGNTQTAVSIALAEKAKESGDWNAVASLFNQRRLANTRRGQEIAMEKLSIALSPEEKYMKQVLDARTRKVKVGADDLKKGETKDKKVARKIARDKETVKKELSQSFKIKEAQSILDKLTC